jgi:asparagine synthase (glutamine-hydrolysing)
VRHHAQVAWCTHLEPLVLLAGHRLVLNEEYLAGWLSFYPACHLTPYEGILAVPPASFVRLTNDNQTSSRYWDFNPGRRIRYAGDGEYEEHFRDVFARAVRRRLRSDVPVLAELSGGIDSSSIVCMADALIACGEAEAKRLDTISYFDDSEPNWNERPFVEIVERKRGRTGFHLAADGSQALPLRHAAMGFAAIPGSNGVSDVGRRFADCVASAGSRVLLSGLGGDEVTGGVPTPEPELADLIVQSDFARLAHQLQAWALNLRKPWLHLLLATLREFLPHGSGDRSRSTPPVNWLQPAFAERQREALRGYESRLTLSGPLPSFQENQRTLNMLRRQLGCRSHSSQLLCEKRFPYLDRDLLEFLYAVPREQLLRPGQRRSLMRRALAGIVPEELLTRKRKGYIARCPLLAIAAAAPQLMEISQQMVTAELGLVNANAFVHAMQRAIDGLEFPFVPWMRTLALELWLRDLRHRSLVP